MFYDLISGYNAVLAEELKLAGAAENDPIIGDVGVGLHLNLRAAVVAGHRLFAAASQTQNPNQDQQQANDFSLYGCIFTHRNSFFNNKAPDPGNGVRR
jgi:hypothetical protein